MICLKSAIFRVKEQPLAQSKQKVTTFTQLVSYYGLLDKEKHMS
jgi:hypothetical protein